MATPDKDCEELRKEHKDLSDQLRRGAILSLTVLSLFVISFARACDKVNGEEAKKMVCQIRKVDSISGADRNVSYVFEIFDPGDTTCDEPCPIPSPNPSLTPAPATASKENAAPDSVSTPDSGAALPEPSERPTPTQAQKTAAADCQKKLEAGLEESAEKWFGVEAPIPGIHITLDLRYWVFLLPLLFFFSGIYLHTLRMKLRLLKALGGYRLSATNPDEVTEVNRLYFDKHSAYARFPGSLGGKLFVVAYLLMPVYLLVAGRSFWADSPVDSLGAIGFCFGLLTFYSVAYGHAVTNRFDDEIARFTNQPKPHNFIRTANEVAKNIGRKIARVLSPRIPLTAGSLLLFATLALTITESGCEDVRRYRGYQVLVGTEGAHWYTAGGVSEQLQGRLMYSASLLLALFVAFVVLFPPLYRKVTTGRFGKFLLIWSGGVFALSLIDFSAAGTDLGLWRGTVGLVIWLVLMIAWLRYRFSRQVTRRKKWVRIRSSLIVFSVPFFVLAIMYGFDNLNLPGLLAYFLGVNFLFLGVLQTPGAHQPQHLP